MSSSLIVADSSAPAPPRAITTKEVPTGRDARSPFLKISRTRRFTRFRSTELPILRDTVTPNRDRSGSCSSRDAYTTK